jgi:hypothetical protein
MDGAAAGTDDRTDGPDGWRALDGGLSAWFETGSLTLGAALAGRIAELVGDAPLPDIDLRSSGVRVRIDASSSEEPGAGDLALADGVSQAARDLGLRADPAALQAVRVEVGTAAPPALTAFWQPVLGYRATGGELHDPSRRWPSFRFSDQRRLARCGAGSTSTSSDRRRPSSRRRRPSGSGCPASTG